MEMCNQSISAATLTLFENDAFVVYLIVMMGPIVTFSRMCADLNVVLMILWRQ
jgi:hypothetical protein